MRSTVGHWESIRVIALELIASCEKTNPISTMKQTLKGGKLKNQEWDDNYYNFFQCCLWQPICPRRNDKPCFFRPACFFREANSNNVDAWHD